MEQPMYKLIVEQGETVESFPLANGENLVGRSHSAGIRLTAADASGKHARILVDGGKVILENLSRYGTSVDGVPLDGSIEIRPGQRVGFGKAVVLRLEKTAAAPAPGAAAIPAMASAPAYDPEKTGAGPAPAYAARPVPEVPAFDPEKTGAGLAPSMPVPAQAGARTQVSGLDKTGIGGAALPADGATMVNQHPGVLGGHSDEPGATLMMQTRVAGAEELDFLRHQELKRGRMVLGGGILLAGIIVIAAIIFWPKPPPPETELEWPKDAAGEYCDKFEPAPVVKGMADGGFDLVYPAAPGCFKVERDPEGIRIVTKVGRDRNIPMVLTLLVKEENPPRLVEEDRAVSINAWLEEWKKSVIAEGGTCNVDKLSPINFYGKQEKGIPFQFASYERNEASGKASWTGTVCFFRHGRRMFVLRTELPANERVRGEGFLFNKYVFPSQAFIRSHWEGSSSLMKTDTGELIRQARIELDRMAPAAWPQVEVMVYGSLRKAARDFNTEQEQEAMKLLERLRERQSLWFNQQRLKYDNAWVTKDDKAKPPIKRQGEAVFSDPEDQRYHIIRRWN
jgi:hypothetical protein